MVVDRRVAFCAQLKAAREKKGVSLDEIAASTKISRSLLIGLESNDVSRWPQGLYRRSYLRDYLRAIDLAPESVVAEFARLFPGEDAPPIDAPVILLHSDQCELSMTLAEDGKESVAARKRALAATFDLAVVLVASGLAWWLTQSNVWTSGAIVALCYYSIGTATLGRTLGSRWLDDRRWRRSGGSISRSRRPAALLLRLRQLRRSKSQDPPVNEHLSGVPGNAALFRTLFLR